MENATASSASNWSWQFVSLRSHRRPARVTAAEAIEQIDIGGPRWFVPRKNHAFCDGCHRAKQYPEILDQVRAAGSTTIDLRRQLAAAAFAHTAKYDRGICRLVCPGFNRKNCRDEARQSFQVAASRFAFRSTSCVMSETRTSRGLYVVQNGSGTSLGGGSISVSARQLNGKELSYNNLLDLDMP